MHEGEFTRRLVPEFEGFGAFDFVEASASRVEGPG